MRHAQRTTALKSRFGRNFNCQIAILAADCIVNQILVLANYRIPKPYITLEMVFEKYFNEQVNILEALSLYTYENIYMRLMQLEGNINTDQRKQGQKSSKSYNQLTREDQSTSVEDPHSHEDENCNEEENSPSFTLSNVAHWSKENGCNIDFETDEILASDVNIEDIEWGMRLSQALDHSKLAGRGIGAVIPEIADAKGSRTPWEIILRSVVTRAITLRPAPSHARPSRRWLASDDYAMRNCKPTPGFEAAIKYMHDVPLIALCIDASGSILMSPDLLQSFISEMVNIANRTGSDIYLITFSDRVLSVDKIKSANIYNFIKDLKISAGGGTDLSCFMGAAAEIKPSAIIVLTDLEGTFGQPPRGVPVIWAVPNSASKLSPPFGTVLPLLQ